MDKTLRVAISLLPGLRCKERLLVEECVGNTDLFSGIGRRDIETIIGRPLRIRNVYPRHQLILDAARRIEIELRQNRICTVGYWDKTYPPQLRESCQPPYLLYVRGRLPSYDVPMVAIVGTRRPSMEGRGAAFSLAAEFAGIGLPVVSGLAFGVDAAAHWGAVKRSCVTIAVLGTSIDRIYPVANSELAHRILNNGGALISEKPPGSRIGKYDFPLRNRIISALTRGVVIVEAPERSGALITAGWAAEDNRNVYVHSAGTCGQRSGGTRRLVDEGALVINHADEIMRDWEIEAEVPRFSRVLPREMTPGELVRRELDEEILRFDGMFYRRVS